MWNPHEIANVRKKFERIVDGLKDGLDGYQRGDWNPFADVEYEDVVAIKEKVVSILNEYEGVVSQKLFLRPTPPAYRGDLDGKKMLELYKKGMSLNKIGELYSCAPSTAKDRIYKAQKAEENNKENNKENEEEGEQGQEDVLPF